MNKLYNEEDIQDIADSIRSKNGSSDTYKVSEMAQAIEDIPSGGDIEEYFGGTITGAGSSTAGSIWTKAVQKLPAIANTGTTCQNLFTNFKGTEIDTSLLNTTNVTNMQSMFGSCENLTSLDLSTFNTTNVTNMSFMFTSCSKLTNLNLSNFNTTNVTTMQSMFNSCSKLTNLNLSNFNTTNVTTMLSMFQSSSSLTSLDLSTFNTTNVTIMQQMFHGCTNLTSLNLSNFNTTNVINMQQMFYNCSNLTSLNLSSFTFKPNTAVNITQMFYLCTKLMHLDMRGLDFTNITNYSNMFGVTGNYVPANCEIIVADDTQKAWINEKFPRMTNVKTVAEYEAE